MKGLSKETGISLSLIGVSIVVNLINYAAFYNNINPFSEIWSLLAFLAGALGVTLVPLIIAAIISIFFILSRKHQHKYIFYFALIFLILSAFSLIVSFSEIGL
jgi:hypothetical protein